MSSAVQSALTSLRQNDYASLAILTAVGYDYVLTFSDEIEYIWNKPWTWVSALFILVRYCGLFNLTIVSLVGSSFLPGPAKACEIMIVINEWIFVPFLVAADLAMILRVWAMYNRERRILRTLLTLFSIKIIFTVFAAAFEPRNLSDTTTIQLIDFSFCVVQPTTFIWTKMAAMIQITHGAAMCNLTIVQFGRQSLQMYRLTKQWQPNRYLILLVRQGILYFFAVFLNALINLLRGSGELPMGGWQAVVFFILEYVPMYTLTPRFILSIRELYARDVAGRRGEGIDTGFGLSLSGRDAVGTAMVFADVQQNGRSEDVEEIPMEVATTQAK